MGEKSLMFRPTDGWADLDVRVKADGSGEVEGIVSGIAVPWDLPTRIDSSLTEEFAPGAFDADIRRRSGVFLARNHMPLGGTPIGRLSVMRNDAAGLYVEGRISRTAVGEETLTLLRDGVLDSLSIGFAEGKNQVRQDPKLGAITRRLTASLREVAIVPTPAYRDARVTGVRGEACPTCAERAGLLTLEHEHTASRSEAVARLLTTLPPLPPVPRSRG